MGTTETDLRIGKAAVSGNCTVVDVRRDDRRGRRWTVEFLSEPRTSPQPLWFHLRADGINGAKVTFIWVNADHCLGDHRKLAATRPVVRLDDGEWQRWQNVRVARAADGRRHLCIQRVGPAESAAVASCYPYATPDLEATLRALGGSVSSEVIGATGAGRPLRRLLLRAGSGEERAGAYVLARQHAGETPGSWVLDGMLRTLAGPRRKTRRAAPSLDWWVVPFVDLDGVENGDYGKDAFPWDFNRAWGRLPLRPEIHSIQRDLMRFRRRYRRRIVLDLHAPGFHEEDLYVFYPRADRPLEQREACSALAGALARVFPKLPREALAKETTYPSRFNITGSVGTWAWDFLQQTPTVSLEISYQRLAGRELGIVGYRDIGRRLVAAVERMMTGASVTAQRRGSVARR